MASEVKLHPSGFVSAGGAVGACLILAACGSARPGLGEGVPHDAGQIVANAAACPVTAAWVAGSVAPIPPVVRCVVPRYPGDLRRSGVEGKVVVRVAVDSAGVPDSASVQLVSATTPGLAAAARRSVPHVRFAPARTGESRPVTVEMPYVFTVTR